MTSHTSHHHHPVLSSYTLCEDLELIAEYSNRLVWIEDQYLPTSLFRNDLHNTRSQSNHNKIVTTNYDQQLKNESSIIMHQRNNEGFQLCLIEEESSDSYGLHPIQYQHENGSGGALTASHLASQIRGLRKRDHLLLEGRVEDQQQQQQTLYTEDDFLEEEELNQQQHASSDNREKHSHHLLVMEKNDDIVRPFTLPVDWDDVRHSFSSSSSSSSAYHGSAIVVGADDCTELRRLDAPSVLLNLRRRFLGDVVKSNDVNEQYFSPMTDIPPLHEIAQQQKKQPCMSQGIAKSKKVDKNSSYDKAHSVNTLTETATQQKPSIYTFAGSVLIAINPHQILEHLISHETLRRYQGCLLKENPPHPFAIAEQCLRRLERTKASQTILISGDSGSGKTETAKLVMRYLVTPTAEASNREDKCGSHLHSIIQEKLLGMSPILEGFGNATTTRNPNSSRFGRLNKLYFKEGRVYCGSGVQTYLLERSRVTHQNYGERNYHVFYYLLNGGSSTLLNRLGLSSNIESYAILKPSQRISSYQRSAQERVHNVSVVETKPGESVIEDIKRDQWNFVALQRALTTNGFTDDDIQGMFEILASILHLGNVITKVVDESCKDGVDSLDARADERTSCLNQSALNQAAKLLQLNPEVLANLIQFRKVSVYVVKRSILGEFKTCQTLIRWLYCTLFDRIIVKGLDMKHGDDEKFIAVLDIYGFEDLACNSLEQLLINIANEKLQNFFVQHLIVSEQEMYKEQDIDWKHIDLPNGDSLMKCLTGKPQLTYLNVSDDTATTLARKTMSKEGHLPAALSSQQKPSRSSQIVPTPCRSGATFSGIANEPSSILQQLEDTGRLVNNDENGANHTSNSTSQCRSPDETFFSKIEVLETTYREVLKWNGVRKGRAMSFTIRHFAGSVTYTVDNWVDKNNDRVAPEIETAFSTSTHPIIKRLLQRDDTLATAKHPPTTKIGKFDPIAKKFVSNVDNMLTSLSKTCLSFIRCFKPNDVRSPNIFDGGLVSQQMRQSGTLELLHIFHHGYPSRIPYRNISHYFTWLLDLLVSQLQATSKYKHINIHNWKTQLRLFHDKRFLCRFALQLFSDAPPHTWQCGKTLLFSRSPMADQLEQLLSEAPRPTRRISNETQLDARSTNERQLVLQAIGWKVRSGLDFMSLYQHMAFKPWRTHVKPALIMCQLLTKVRIKRVCSSITQVFSRSSFLHWRLLAQQLPSIVPIKKSVHTTSTHPSPWYTIWRHNTFEIPDNNSNNSRNNRSVLFFDGHNLWIADQLPLPTTGNIRGAHRLYFECSKNQKTGTLRVSAPSRRKPEPLPLQDCTNTSESSTTTPQLCDVEERVLAINRHPRNSNLFIVVTSSLCLSTFVLFPANPNEEMEQSQSQQLIDPSLTSNGDKYRNVLGAKKGIQKTAASLSTHVKVSRIGRFIVDLKKTFASSTTSKINPNDIHCLKVCFPLRESETIVIVLWALDLPSWRDTIPKTSKGLLTIIDLLSGNVIGYRKFKLPSILSLANAVKRTPEASRRSVFLWFPTNSVRPAFRFLYQHSVLLPLHSGRGLVLAGCGFLFIFALRNLFSTLNSTPAMDLQLIWSSVEDAQTTTEKKILLNWISTAIIANRTPLKRTSIARTSLSAQPLEDHHDLNKPMGPETVVLGTMRGNLFVLRLTPPNEPLSVWSLHFITYQLFPWDELCPIEGRKKSISSSTSRHTGVVAKPRLTSAAKQPSASRQTATNTPLHQTTATGKNVPTSSSRLTTPSQLPQTVATKPSYSGILKIFELPSQHLTLPSPPPEEDLSTPLPKRSSALKNRPSLYYTSTPVQAPPLFLVLTYSGALFLLRPQTLFYGDSIEKNLNHGAELSCICLGKLGEEGEHLKLSSASVVPSQSSKSIADITVSAIYSTSIQTYQIQSPSSSSSNSTLIPHLHLSRHSIEQVLYSKGTTNTASS